MSANLPLQATAVALFDIICSMRAQGTDNHFWNSTLVLWLDFDVNLTKIL